MGPHVSPCSKKRLPGAEGPPEGKRAYKAVDVTVKGGYILHITSFMLRDPRVDLHMCLPLSLVVRSDLT